MPPIAATVLGATLAVVPVAVVVAVRARRDRPLWALALDVPLAVALDLLLVLSLTRLMRLEIATLVSRVLWLGVLAAAFVRARRKRGEQADRAWPAWPTALGRFEGGAATAGAIVGLSISALGAWPYSIWDRRWHTPVSGALRGQTLPFHNAVAQSEVLHYHFGGDVWGALIQSLSFGTLHSSWALSVAHNVMFMLTGAALVLLLAGLAGRRGAIVGVLLTAAVLLSGPLTVGSNPQQPRADGYSVINFLSLSFRPHDALAALFFVGFTGAVAARIWRRGAPEQEGAPRIEDTLPALLGTAAGLAISDETSLGMLGLSLGLTWLVWPDVVHPRRGPGVLIFLGLMAALIVPNLAFAATLSPGAQRNAIKLVDWRSPGCYMPTLPLFTAKGMRMLLFDAAPTLVSWLGAGAALALRRRPRAAPLFAMCTGLVLLSYFALTRIDVDGQALESHRFASGVQYLAPFIAALMLLDAPDEAPPAFFRGTEKAGNVVPAALVLLGAWLGAWSTAWWIQASLPKRGHHNDHFDTNIQLYDLDCRKDLGVTLGEVAVPTYVTRNLYYPYSGCHPAYVPAHNDNHWTLTIGMFYVDKAALKVLDDPRTGVAKSEPLTVVCERPLGDSPDHVCAWATANAPCENLGALATRCTLDARQRAAALRAIR